MVKVQCLAMHEYQSQKNSTSGSNACANVIHKQSLKKKSDI